MTILAASQVSMPQYKFLSSPAQWAIYGGAAGGGKTHALCMDPLRHCQGPTAVPTFSGSIFRRVHPEITNPGGLMDFTKELYEPFTGGNFHGGLNEHRFPSGAKVTLDAIQFDKNLREFQGAQFSWVGFDEATSFPLKYIQYIWSRCRSTSGVKTTLRMTCNPDNDHWLYGFLYWWLDPNTGFPIPERDAVVRHFMTNQKTKQFEWYDEPQYRMVKSKRTGIEKLRVASTSATFVKATLDDNPHLDEGDESYRTNLENMDEQERQRFLDGCWLASSVGDVEWPRELFLGLYVDDEKFPVPEHFAGQGVVRMFSVDPSKGRNPKEGDYSAIVCLAQTNDLAYIDADLKRRPPGQIVEDLFLFCDDPLHRIRSGDLIGIETLQFQELFRDMIHQYAKDNPDYALSAYLRSGSPIIQIEDTLNKMMRIRRLDRPIRNRSFRFRQNPGTTLLLQQLKTFTGIPKKGLHDDGADALDAANQLPRHREEMYKRMREGKM